GLDARGLLESTAIVIMGDHGDAFGEHGPRQHTLALYEETLHVPMLVHLPGGARAGERVRGPRQEIDVLPTIADILGFEIEGGRAPGRSVFEETPIGRRLFFS